jgi:alpha-tubulin suppressor-like RCC1 family protein
LESSDESVAKFSKVNGKLSIVGAGKTTITASQPANDDYLAASKNFVLTVRKGTPVLTATADLSGTFGEDGPTITKPTSESRGAISFTSSNVAVATVNATTGQVTVVGAGTTTITSTQAATDDYVSATQTLTFTVKQAVPKLGTFTIGSKTFGNAEFAIEKPTSPSSGTFTFTSNDSKVIKISEAGKATIEGAGKATITATQAASGNYSATSTTTEITVAKAAPELSNISLTGLVFGDADSTMEPRSTSSGAFTFSSNNTRVITIDEKTGRVRVAGAGTATITVKQASTTNYEAASSSVTVQVGLATPAFERLDPITKEFGDASFLWNWGTSPSDGAITFTSNNPAAATIDATTGRVTIVSTGVTTLTMTQAKGTNHTAASVVSVLTIDRATPVFGDFVIANKTYGATPFLLTSPTSTSSGAFSFASSNTSVATVNSTTGLVTIVAPGSVEITATQAQTLTHTASTIRTTFVVDPASPTFGTFTAPSKIFGDTVFTMSPPSSPSSGAFSFSSSNTGVATISSSGVVTIVGAGSTTITANQAAATPYAAQTAATTLTVAKATPTLSSLGGDVTKIVGDQPFTPSTPSSASTGAITYSSSNTAIATVNLTSGLITVVSGGTTVITATQAATANYNSTTVTTTLTVLRDPMIGAMPAITKAYGSAAFTLTAPTSNSSGAISYTSSNASVATIDSNTRLITLTGAGSTTITASQVATSTYTSASTSTTLTVEAAPEITQLSLSNVSSCALTSTGAMKCWGSNAYGQIGTLASNQQKTPIDVPGFTNNISAIAVGDSRMCALTTTGEVKCIGNGVADSNNPGISSGAISISSGYAYSCALMSYGGVKCWGDNWTGQLGSGTWVNTAPAVHVKGLTSGVTAITSGIMHSCALLSNGSVKCWGANNYGQLGDGTNSNRNEPAQVIVGGQPISGVVSISGGYEHTCAVMANGEAKCWGRNGYGELGDGTTTNRSVPTSVIVNSQPISGIASISGGLRHTCAVTTGGAAKCWGYNALASLGNGTFTDSLTPVNVDGLGSGVLSIEASKSFATCATVTGSSVKCWGHSWAGNVGDGFTTDRSSPVNVVGLMSSSPSATTLGALTLPGSQYTTTSPNFTLTAPTSNRAGTITFASSNPAVATVDAATGVVQITGTGTAVLAAAIGGNGQYRAASAQVTITVGS